MLKNRWIRECLHFANFPYLAERYLTVQFSRDPNKNQNVLDLIVVSSSTMKIMISWFELVCWFTYKAWLNLRGLLGNVVSLVIMYIKQQYGWSYSTALIINLYLFCWTPSWLWKMTDQSKAVLLFPLLWVKRGQEKRKNKTQMFFFQENHFQS